MLRIEEYVSNLKESNTILNEQLRMETQQSKFEFDDETQFQNPVYRMAPLEHFQSISENKYSNIFSSYIQSPNPYQGEKRQELKTPKKRAFSFAESKILQPKLQQQQLNTSQYQEKQSSTTCFFGNTNLNSRIRIKSNYINQENTLKDKSILNSNQARCSEISQRFSDSPKKIKNNVDTQYVSVSFANENTKQLYTQNDIQKNDQDKQLLEITQMKQIKEYVACIIF